MSSQLFRIQVGRRTMEYLQQRARGRGRAVPRDKVLFHLKTYYFPRLQDRMFRDIYSGLPVCTTAKGEPRGLFIPTTPEEVEAFRVELFEKVPGVIATERYRTVLAHYPHLAPRQGKQANLFMEES